MNEPPSTPPADERDHETQLRDMNEALLVSSVRQHELTEQAQKAETGLRASEERLAAELAATQWLLDISTQMIRQGDVEALYGQILEAAMGIMHSDGASMQTLDQDRDALRLLASRGFDPGFAQTFEWVGPDAKTACSIARRAGHRVVVPDVETCDFIVGTPALEDHRKTGIRAVQSTPLFSRVGQMLGVISTHWRRPHQPLERDLRLLDVLARQTADLIERSQAERHRDLLVNELNHRVKNTLATVQSIATQTLRETDVDGAVREVLQARILALARAHDLLSEESWESARLRDIVERALAPYRSREERFAIEGPDVRLSPKSALALAMALHELATNAAKYGALSKQAGRVSVLWATAGDDGRRHLLLRWVESGGPPVEPPKRRGFGSRLIERGFAGELGEAGIDYEPTGLVCTINAPLSEGGSGSAKGAPTGEDHRS